MVVTLNDNKSCDKVCRKESAQMGPQQELQKAIAFHQTGDLVSAERSYRAFLKVAPRNFDANYLLGVLYLQTGQFSGAEKQLDRATKINPHAPNAFNDHGNALLELDRVKQSLKSYNRAIALDPKFAEAINNRGNALARLNQFEEAVASFDKAISIKPDYARAYYNRGNSLRAFKNYTEALASYDRAIAIEPKYIEAHNNRGNTLFDLYQLEEALAAYDKVISLNPLFAEAHSNRASVLTELRRVDEALRACDTALTLNGDLSEAWVARGDAMRVLPRFEQSLAAYDQAIKLNPQMTDAWAGRAAVLNGLKRHHDSVVAFERLLQLVPDGAFIKGKLVHQKMLACEWSGLTDLERSIDFGVRAGKQVVAPFVYQPLSSSAQDLKRCAEIYTAEKLPPQFSHSPYNHDRVRLGYVSGEFRQQATAILIVELLELHDRNRFELFAFDNGFDDGSEIRQRINATANHIVDIRQLDDARAAAIIKQNEIDILVNLNGFFGEERTRVFAHRPAPIQVNYLGFPGTMGVDYMDYIIADQCVIPPDQQGCYVEKIVYLPDTYQVNDSKRRIADRTPTRSEAMLPENGFVFCCFNNNYKIVPEIFDIWMRLLKEISGSVLWLLDGSADASSNLRSEAKKRGIDPSRLVFAPRLNSPEHLARHRLADLFLDTLPCNAHTTGSDALWAGLPILTCLGTTFAGRVAASLLNAIGLPELVTHSLSDYESLAMRLARDPDAVKHLKTKLAQNRLRYPLFDTKRFARHIEAAYTMMGELYQRGEPPVRLTVAPLPHD
jgi:predicted O-linked N-acetylglucosamine transferase (SPINDLY family)